MTREQISNLVTQLGDIIGVLQDADPADRAQVYQQLGLRLTYHPGKRIVRVRAQPAADEYGKMVCVRGATQSVAPQLTISATLRLTQG